MAEKRLALSSTRILLYVTALAIMAASANLSAMPALARPDEVTIIVKDQLTNKAVGENVLIIICPEQDPLVQTYLFTDLDGKVVLYNDGNWAAGDSYIIGEPNYGVFTQVGAFTLHHNCGARVTVYVDPLH